MKIMKKPVLFILAMFVTTLMILTSCSKDNPAPNSETASTSIGAKATFNLGRAVNDVTITKFMVNVKNIELEFDDDVNEGSGGDDNNGGFGPFYNDIELDGPFELEFTTNGIVIPFVNVDLPVAQYEELEFEIAESNNQSSVLFQKSILIEGTVNTIPFLFWHNFEEGVEVDFEDANTDIIIENNGNSILINFDLNFLFNTSIIDLSTATDGNADGVIEISPNDNDGNNALANTNKNIIKQSIDLLDD